MIITGGCRGNGSQLADYLLDTKVNERVQVIGAYGTMYPHDLKKSLLEMSLTSELSSRTDAGLYHAQLSPRVHEGALMSEADKLRAVEIFNEHMGLAGQKWVLVEQEKLGRIHYHVAVERYNHRTGTMWDDEQNYKKHQAAARAMEMEFGWAITHQETNRLDADIKAHLLSLWERHDDAATFSEATRRAGFELVQGIGKRPYELVDRHGTVHDLARQLAGVRQKDVAERLNPIRATLRETTVASHERREQDQRRSEILAEMSENALQEAIVLPITEQAPSRAVELTGDMLANAEQLVSVPDEPLTNDPAATLTAMMEQGQAMSQAIDERRQRQLDLVNDLFENAKLTDPTPPVSPVANDNQATEQERFNAKLAEMMEEARQIRERQQQRRYGLRR